MIKCTMQNNERKNYCNKRLVECTWNFFFKPFTLPKRPKLCASKHYFKLRRDFKSFFFFFLECNIPNGILFVQTRFSSFWTPPVNGREFTAETDTKHNVELTISNWCENHGEAVSWQATTVWQKKNPLTRFLIILCLSLVVVFWRNVHAFTNTITSRLFAKNSRRQRAHFLILILKN